MLSVKKYGSNNQVNQKLSFEIIFMTFERSGMLITDTINA